MKRFLITAAIAVITLFCMHAKTLIVYYSYTNTTKTVVDNLRKHIKADELRIEPAQKGLDYAADDYKIGSELIAAIRENPDKTSSYPGIDPVKCDLSDYDTIVVATPLWWSNMAAPMQTYLFENGAKMKDKKIALVVCSWSSGIDDVVRDAHRLIPGGDFLTPALWVKEPEISEVNKDVTAWLKKVKL